MERASCWRPYSSDNRRPRAGRRGWPKIGLLSAALLLCGLACAGQPPPVRTPLQRVLPPPPGKLYHGVYPGGRSGEEDDITPADVSSYENTVGKRVAWVCFSNNWYTSPRFPTQTAEWIRSSGAVPYIRLMLRGEDNTQGDYTVERIIAGDHDRAFTEWAEAARTFHGPLLVEYGTEVNGKWFPWNGMYHGGGTTTGFGDPALPDGPERFVAAYRHIVDLMRAAGAANITWVFHVNATDWPDDEWNQFEHYYPGDSYVDWIGVSAYGAQSPLADECPGFRSMMDPCYARLSALAPTKPVFVAEFGCCTADGLTPPDVWAARALDDILGGRWPRLIGFSWWNERWENDDNPAHDSNMRVQDNPALAGVFYSKLAAAAGTIQQRPYLRSPRVRQRIDRRSPRRVMPSPSLPSRPLPDNRH